MLEKIKKDLNNFRKVKYEKILFTKKNLNLRKRAINFIFNLNTKVQNKKIDCQSCKFYSKNLNKKNFILFYKKFNSRIQLKEKYDLINFKKKSNRNACIQSYIIFCKFLIKDKNINDIQKLNTILKINDLLILKFNKNKHRALIENFKKNIQYEKKLLKLYL
tara:strand:+ start:579 stop:1064 length:486 start_codon:yes stop_codon:yes gene_type:complete